MAKLFKLVGGAGTGKTARLLSIIEKLIGQGIDPMSIIFVSMTRAARQEAAERMEDKFGISSDDLQGDGFFKTMHSICFRAIRGEERYSMIGATKADREWLRNTLGDDVTPPSDTEDTPAESDHRSPVASTMQAWNVARSRLVPLSNVLSEFRLGGTSCLSDEDASRLVKHYESCKRIDGKIDFVDMLSRFAGITHYPDEHIETSQEGSVPAVPAIFFDEWQDASRLMQLCADRLMSQSGAKYCYASGDIFQAIHGYAGSDPDCFGGMFADHTEIMKQSWRCPRGVLDLSELTLRPCRGYFDREISPREMSDGVTYTSSFASLADVIKSSREDWLLIARSKFYAGKLQNALGKYGIPWDYTKSEGGYITPKQRRLATLFLTLEGGDEITPDAWSFIVGEIPQKLPKDELKQFSGLDPELLVHGIKAEYKREGNLSESYPRHDVQSFDIDRIGGTQTLRTLIESGQWVKLSKSFEPFMDACRTAGTEIANKPRIRVGTIHSVKGKEADNVVLLTSMSRKNYYGTRIPDRADEERRVSYVGITRARKQLCVLNQDRDEYRIPIG